MCRKGWARVSQRVGTCVVKGGHVCGRGWVHVWQRVGTCVAKSGHMCGKGGDICSKGWTYSSGQNKVLFFTP